MRACVREYVRACLLEQLPVGRRALCIQFHRVIASNENFAECYNFAEWFGQFLKPPVKGAALCLDPVLQLCSKFPTRLAGSLMLLAITVFLFSFLPSVHPYPFHPWLLKLTKPK
jgi:hypothetical protein